MAVASVPTTKPPCTAIVSHAVSPDDRSNAPASDGVTAVAENHSDMPSSSAAASHASMRQAGAASTAEIPLTGGVGVPMGRLIPYFITATALCWAAGSDHGPSERHHTAQVGWLRAGVLGANDGLISTSSLVVGVAAAAGVDHASVLLTASAGLVAGALSMAAGEYVSVSSQADTERADYERERRELADDPAFEHEELAGIYRARGLSAALADQVAGALMAHDALGAHARDELHMTETSKAQPLQAALTSAAAFGLGAALPVAVTMLVPVARIGMVVAGSTLVLLAALGAAAARLGGAPMARGAARVTFWGAVAMAATALVGRLFGAAL